MAEFDLFKNICAGCGNTIMSYALDKHGTLPTVFCGGVCQTNYEGSKRMIEVKNIVSDRRGMTTEEVTKRMSQKAWTPNNGGQYVLEEQIIKEELPI